ncbi:N-glycosylase/DNA lyase [Aeromonas hydrophila]|uniref:8-oxoguanine DNA glycosylase n=1 Tax=Aeromonas hydrophila TaxID=644 RepID=UPI002169E4B3|nr:hypothetical protein [Aeromonas hydrophila]MCS3770423.1 N-glycosylase/DNA lyase [Aeromonas hydrophila]
MNHYTPEALSRAVAAVCPDIRSRIDTGLVSDERHLWWELSCCILSSQVPYPLAIAAADAIDKNGCLHQDGQDYLGLADRLFDLLSAPFDVEGKTRHYRFPKARAGQLAATWIAVTTTAGSLNSLISCLTANDMRVWLVTHAPGVGPKQASMFLRNCGITYDLAILDRHVLNYMSAQGIYSGGQTSISGLNQYGRHEKTLRNHAQELDCPVGLLDWAIWVVMRVASKKQETISI